GAGAARAGGGTRPETPQTDDAPETEDEGGPEREETGAGQRAAGKRGKARRSFREGPRRAQWGARDTACGSGRGGPQSRRETGKGNPDRAEQSCARTCGHHSREEARSRERVGRL